MAHTLFMLTACVAMLLGFDVMAGAALCGISFAYWKTREWLDDRRHRRECARRKAEAEAFANRLMNDSWWFSEDEPTMKLLQHIADQIAKRGALNFHVGNTREAWRDARVVAAGEAAAKEGSGSPV